MESIPIQSGVGLTGFIPIGSNTFILQSNGTTATWVSTSSIFSGFSNTATLALNANTATNIAGGTAGQVPYQSAPSITAFTGPGTTGQLLVSRGTSGPTFQSTATIQTLNVGNTWTGGAVGEIRAAGEITAYYASDRRLKENIYVIESPVEKIEKISGYMFDWTDEYLQSRGGEDDVYVRKHDIGVIAQEIENILPEVVATRDNGYLAVRYEKIVPLLIEAVKALSQEIRDIKKNIK
jgi:hypothetical protein